MIPLSPFITNLDTSRIENGEHPTERTTRQWANSLKTADGLSMKCDVVNGGYDQRAYMLVPPKHEQIALKALKKYKNTVFPFSQREARFRESIGPPSIIHISTKLMSSLQVFDSLSSATVWKQAPDSIRKAKNDNPTPDINNDHNSISSTDSRSLDHSVFDKNVSQSTKFSAQETQKQKLGYEKTKISQQQDGGTSATASTKSGNTSAINSTYNARFHELDAMIKRQHFDHERSAKLTSERFRQMEQQLHRLDSLDNKPQQQDNYFVNLEKKLLQSLESQLSLGYSMNQMKEQLQTQLDMLMNAVKNIQVHSQLTSKSTVHQDQAHIDMEIVDFQSVQWTSASSQTSKLSVSSNNIKSPEKKKTEIVRKIQRLNG
jgi:hypothetical protein